jgi:translation initiation factor 3 subunit C
LALRRIETTYYLHDNILNELRNSSDEDSAKVIETAFPKSVNTEKEIHALATHIYPNDETNRVRVELYHIYHHAIHNRLSIARDYLLMSKISENINNREVQDQILYNRVLVQMGLASFRIGNISDCVQYLNEMCSHLYRNP